MSSVQIRLFGKPELFYDQRPLDIQVKKALALLAYLATTRRAHSRERLAALLWPNANEEVARTSLRQAIRALRETPLSDALITDRASIALDEAVYSDVQSFQTEVDLLRPFISRPELLTMEQVVRLQAAAALYSGDFMDEFTIPGSPEWDDWQQFRRIEFQYQATKIFSALAHYYTDRQLADSGLRMAGRWLELDPHNEDAHRLKMRLYALSRQTERAIEQYHFLVRLLAREQARMPEPQTQHLYEQIRAGGFLFTTAPTPDEKQMRSLLPRPLTPLPTSTPAHDRIRQALGTFGTDMSAPLVLVYHPNPAYLSALIGHIAHQAEVHTHFDSGILWAALDSDLDAIIRLWLDAMRISVLKSTSKLEHLVWQYHNGLRGKQVLTILEHLTEPDTARLLIPGYPGCTLLATTAQQEVMQALTGAPHRMVDLDHASLSDKAALLF